MKLLVAVWLMLGLSVMASAFPVVVRDDRGEDIQITHPPQRVVVIEALYGEIMVDLGAAELVVGTAESPDIPDELQGKPSVGPSFSPSVETILALEPDLVLGAWGEVRDQLERAGVPVFTAGGQAGYIAGVTDLFGAIRAVGRAIGLSEKAAELIGLISVDIVAIEGAVLGRQGVAAAFLFMQTPDSPPYAIGRGTIEHELLLRAGGVNVFADVDGFPQVSLEEVLARDPHVILTHPTQVEHVYNSQQLKDVTAIREGHVYGISSAELTSTRVADALREMAKRMHPEAFAGD